MRSSSFGMASALAALTSMLREPEHGREFVIRDPYNVPPRRFFGGTEIRHLRAKPLPPTRKRAAAKAARKQSHKARKKR